MKLQHTLILIMMAAEAGDWTAVRGLHPGDRIGVVQRNQRRVEGRFASASETGIVVESQGLVTIAQGDVVRVYRQGGMTRKKKMLIGAVAGLGAGAAIAAGVGKGSNGEGVFAGSGGGAAAAGAVAGGAGIGLAIGSLLGNGYETVYQLRGEVK